ncbi:MAG: NTP transferase domain-containing protein [Acidimicrobiia bacterium]|nr:NTP transferase domain-containing protein [Acidimicrobiia bacterium]
MSGRALSALVLAAGPGSRMRSSRPKSLHLLCGRPMLLYVLDSLGSVDVARTVVVIGPGAERITKRVGEDAPDLHVDFVEQLHPRGTADAVAAGLSALPDEDPGDDDVLVLAGDLPLLSPATVAGLVERHRSADSACTLLVARGTPEQLGDRSRVVRGRRGTIMHLRRPDEPGVLDELDLLDVLDEVGLPGELAPGEATDLRAEPAGTAEPAGEDGAAGENEAAEAAVLVCCFRRSSLGPALRRIVPDPFDGEYRLFDVIEVLDRAGYPVGSHEADLTEVAEVADRARLADVEAELRRRLNLGWLRAGVTFVDPVTAYVDATVELGRDVTIFPNTLLQGRTVVGEGAEIGPDTRLVDCAVGARARVERTTGRDAEVGAGATVGPFVALEPGAQVPRDGRVPPFTTVREL